MLLFDYFPDLELGDIRFTMSADADQKQIDSKVVWKSLVSHKKIFIYIENVWIEECHLQVGRGEGKTEYISLSCDIEIQLLLWWYAAIDGKHLIASAASL